MEFFNQHKNRETGGQSQAPEEILWTGKSSQWKNFKTYSFCVLMLFAVCLAACIVEHQYKNWIMLFALYPLGRALYAWFELRITEYKLTNQRLIFRYGVFNRMTSEIELYRIREVFLLEPWYERIVGLGDIRLQASLRSIPDFYIPAVKHAGELRETLRAAVEKLRAEKSADEFDTN
jgi:uncharacterized membrane protein YdbT with pleckstrin-like domain